HERTRVGIAGSSLGGLVSLYGLFARPDVFGLAGVFSPAFWWSGRRIFDFVAGAEAPPARIYLDAGGREHHDERIRSAYVDGVGGAVRGAGAMSGRVVEDRLQQVVLGARDVRPHVDDDAAETLPAGVRRQPRLALVRPEPSVRDDRRDGTSQRSCATQQRLVP